MGCVMDKSKNIQDICIEYNRLLYKKENRSPQEEQRMRDIERIYADKINFMEHPALVFRVAKVKLDKENQNNNTIMAAKNEKQND